MRPAHLRAPKRRISPMIRALALAAVVAMGVAAPAFAESATKPAVRGNLFTEQQARNHLYHLGYTSVSVLSKDENGVWHGSASKDGKTLNVAVDIKGTAAN